MPAIHGLILGWNGTSCETNGIFLCCRPSKYLSGVQAALNDSLAWRLGIRGPQAHVVVLLGTLGSKYQLCAVVVPQLMCDLWISYSSGLVDARSQSFSLDGDSILIRGNNRAQALYFTRPEHLLMVNRKRIHHVTVYSAGLTRGSNPSDSSGFGYQIQYAASNQFNLVRGYGYMGHNCNKYNASHVELIALIEALVQTERICTGDSHISIRCESEAARRYLRKPFGVAPSQDHRLRGLVLYTRHLLAEFNSYDVEYVPKHANEDAYQLARKALQTKRLVCLYNWINIKRFSPRF